MTPDMASLESALSFWETWGYVALAFVLVGVIGEAIAEFTNLIHDESTSKKFEKASALILIVGLAAELITQPSANIAGGRLIAFLNSQIAPRRLSLTQCQGIADSMKPFAGKKVRVQSYAGDAEGSTLAIQIIVCMESSKTVEVEHALASIMPLGGFGSGIFVDGTDKELTAAIRIALGEKGNLVLANGTGWFAGNMSIENSIPPEPLAAANVVVAVKPVPEMTIK